MAAQGVGPGPGSAAPPGLEAARQKLALRRKKVLNTPRPLLSGILVDLLKLNVAPLAVFQMLKSMCAGQRLASEPQDPAAVSLPTSSVQTEVRAGPVSCSFSLAGNSIPLQGLLFLQRSCGSPVLPPRPAANHTRLSLQAPGSPPLSCCFLSFAGNKGSAALGGALALAERSSREGSSQRMPRQPSATRLPKGGGPGKSPTRGST
uniref:Mitotic-spindle organizing protein 2B n=1 Tax=Pan troglodytes TaxID=9598 RepID=A0A2I3TKL5_PANTR